MRILICRFCLSLLTLLFLQSLVSVPIRAQGMEVLHFEQASIGSNPPAPLWGHLSIPAGEGPFPAVLLMHGCGGIQNSHLAWIEVLKEAGYATLLMDSLRPRSIFNGCLGFDSRISPPNIVRDALGGLAVLSNHPGIDPEKIAVLGWSMGATAALGAIAENGLASKFDKSFAGAIAFYPYCTGRRRHYTEALILTGEKDDWTPAAPCQRLQEASVGEVHPITMITYPDAHHAFDETALVHGFSIQGEDGKMHLLKYNKPAHEDSIRQVLSFLDLQFAD